MSITHYTEEEMNKMRKIQNAFGNMVDALKQFTCDKVTYTDSMNKDNMDKYGFISLPASQIMEELQEVIDYIGDADVSWRDAKFIDCGCGIGNVMALAQGYFWDSHGIELNPVTAKFSKLLGKVFVEDILTFKKYKDYDVIYYYCPFKDWKQQKEFEKKVENDCKVGAIIIANLKADTSILEDKRFKKISKRYAIYQKVKQNGRKN